MAMQIKQKAKVLIKRLLTSIRKVIADHQLEKTRLEKVFTDIYLTNAWGGERGEFCSGDGSRDEQVIASYIGMIAEKITALNFQGSTFVDLGCGDFHVGKRMIPYCGKYVGVDIVKELVDRNNKIYGNENVTFVACNIVENEFPAGDVCFLRQVLQHLSNEEILAILPKLKKYKYCFITEHHPSDDTYVVPNIDKVHGGDIRITNNSGVYLSEPPFSILEEELEIVLEVQAPSSDNNHLAGILRTYLYKPKR